MQEYEAIYKASLAVASFPLRGQPSKKRQQELEPDERYRFVFASSHTLMLNLISREEDRKRILVSSDPEPVDDPNAMET